MTTFHAHAAGLFAAALFAATAAIAQTPLAATFSGTDGSYATVANWGETSAVPVNDALTIYHVTIPLGLGNPAVVFDLATGTYALGSLTLGDDVQFSVGGGNSLTVENGFDLGARLTVSGSGTAFTATAGSGAIDLAAGAIEVADGAAARFEAASLTASTAGTYSADGTGSLLDLAMLTTMEHTGDGSQFAASNNGTIDLSSLTASTGVNLGGTTDDWVRFLAGDGGTLRLWSLETLTGPHILRAYNGGTITTMDSAASTLRTLTLNGADGPILDSTGSRSLLDLRGFSAITREGDAMDFRASYDGVIDLSNLQTITHVGTEYYGFFGAATGGVIHLNALTEVSGPNIFRADAGGTIEATSATPRTLSLTGANFSQFIAYDSGALINFSSFANLEVHAIGASFSAESDGLIDLRGLEHLTVEAGSWPSFTATDGGTINLFSLTSVTGAHSLSAARGGSILTLDPAAPSTPRDFVADFTTATGVTWYEASHAGSLLDLSGFRSISRMGEGLYIGAYESGTSTLANLESSTSIGSAATEFVANVYGQLDLFALAELIGPHSIRAENGGVVSTLDPLNPTATRDLTVHRDPATGMSWFEARGTNSLLDFSGFHSLTRSGGGVFIGAADSSTASLANLVSSTSETGANTEFVAREGGQIDLGALASLMGPHSIRAESGSTVTTLSLAAPSTTRDLVISQTASHDGTYFNGVGSGSRLDLNGFRSIETVNGAGLWIGAEQSGLTDLSNLESLTASDTWVSSLNANTLGTITLGALSSIHGGHSFNVASGGTITTDSAAAPRTLTISGPAPVFFRAVDSGSLLDFTSIGTLDLQGTEIAVYAENSGTVAFPDLATSEALAGNSISYNARTSGTITLPVLSRIAGPHSFRATTGGGIDTTSHSGAPTRDLVVDGTDTTVFFAANDKGSLLDLRGFRTLAAGDTVGLWFGAQDGGRIDLSNLGSFTASTERGASLQALNNGQIYLTTLTQINGSVYLDAANGGTITTESLDAPRTLTFTGTTSTTFRAENAGSQLSLGSIGAFDLQADEVSIFAEDSGIVSLSDLATSKNTSGNLIAYYAASGGTISLPALAEVDRTHAFTAENGGLITLAATGSTPRNLTISGSATTSASFRATGAGSRLDFTSVGALDLQADEVSVFAENNGTVAFPDLVTSKNTSGRLMSYYAFSGGTLRFGQLETLGANSFTASNSGSTIEAISLDLGSATRLSLGTGTTLRLGGNYRFSSTDRYAYSTSSATVAFTGSGTFEIGGFDAGAIDPGNNGNFGFGRFALGAAGAPVTVRLLDLVDNGNRGTTFAEALYLYGTGGLPGLSLSGGSELWIDTLNVYVQQTGGTWLNLQSLFNSGELRIAFDDGFVVVPEPATYAALLGAASCAIVLIRRRKTAGGATSTR